MTDESGLLGGRGDTADLADVEPLHLELPAEVGPLAGVRHRLTVWTRSAGLAGVDIESVVLAAYEALANAAEHAFGRGEQGSITLTAELSGGRLRVRVTDTGRWRAPAADPGMRGRGLRLIEGLAHASSVRPGPGGTTVDMSWHFAT